MKRFFAVMLALCICLSLTLCIVSCDSDGDENTSTEDTSAKAETEGESTSDETTSEESTSEETTEADDSGYKVKVVDTDGNPLEGVYIQLCTDEVCGMPTPTGADGYALFKNITDPGRKAKIGMAYEGYVVDTEKYYEFEDDPFELIIVLEKAEA